MWIPRSTGPHESILTGLCLHLLVTLLPVLIVSPTAAVDTAPVFGPKEYVRNTGSPTTVTDRFPVCRPGAFRLRVENGPGGLTRVSSGTLAVNGTEVLRPTDFNQHVTLIERPVTLHLQNTLTVRLAGKPGGTLVVSILGEAGCLDVTLTTPAPGAILPVGLLLVRGTIQGGPGVGVAVNSHPMAVERGAFAGLVDVDTDVTELVAVATAPGGSTAKARQAVTVVPVPEAPVRLLPSPAGGMAPLTVAFSLSSTVGLVEVALDLEGNGSVEFRGASLDGREFTYAQPGIYTPTVQATGSDGRVHSATAVIEVYDAAALDARLQVLWQGLKDAIRRGDLARAISFVHSDTRDAYAAQLGQLRATTLANIDIYMTTIQRVEVGPGGAQYEMLRQRDGVTLSFAVWFQIDRDGLWRLRRF